MDDEVVELLQNYVPGEDAVLTLRKQRLIIFAGITSAGKNTIMNELLKTGEYHDIVTSTTRLPRENDGVMEIDGQDYHFLTMEEAMKRLKNREYLEAANVHGKINGVLASEFEKASETGKVPILDVDVQGVETFKKLSNSVIAVFVVPPSYEEWVSRMKKRYPSQGAFEEAWPARRESAIMELETALSKPYYHFIVNESLQDAVHAAYAIAHKSQDEFNQIDKSFHVWAEQILSELKGRTI
jgi:guanylate kinase